MNSEETERYVIAAAAALELPIASAHLPGVILNFERLAGIAAATKRGTLRAVALAEGALTRIAALDVKINVFSENTHYGATGNPHGGADPGH